MHRIRKFLSVAAVLAAASSFAFAPDTAHARKRGVLEGEPIVRKKLQLRRLRFQVTPTLGMSLSQPFVHMGYAGARLGFHFTEWLGLRAGFLYGAVPIKSALLKDLEAPPEQGGLPVALQNGEMFTLGGGTCQSLAGCRDIPDRDNPAPLRHDFRAGLTQATWQSSVDVVFTPFVGKLGLFSALFTEYDMYVFGGLGLMGWGKHYPDDENSTSSTDRANLVTDPSQATYCQETINGATSQNAECVLHPVQTDDGLHLGVSFGGGVHLFATDWMAINVEIQDIVTRNNLTGLNATVEEPRPVVNNKDKDIFHNVTLQLGFKFYIPFKAKRTK